MEMDTMTVNIVFIFVIGGIVLLWLLLLNRLRL